MKKILIALTIAISCLGISNVNAETLYLTDTTEQNFSHYRAILGNDNFNTIINDVLSEYKNTYVSSYPYFIISPNFYTYKNDNNEDVLSLDVILSYYKEIPTMPWSYSLNGATGVHSVYTRLSYDNNTINRRYYIYNEDGDYSFDINTYEGFADPYLLGILDTNNGTFSDNEHYHYNPYLYYVSNFDLYLEPLNNLKGNISSNTYIWNYDSFGIPTFDSETNYRLISFDKEDYLIEPYYLYDNDVNVSIPNLEEINLNDYAYVALSLKDYNKKAFETTIQVKGQYCLTPVYNYGMTERKDILEGTQVDRCSPYYDNYTPIRTYILENDLKNNAIYYLKSYDTTRDNYIKIDTSVFDVTYVTEENKDNPYVSIGGKTYPTIPYDNLTDTATKSEDEGYVSGAVKGFSFSDIFTAPMEFLEDIWDSIVSVFDLVKEFFSLLPEPIPTFLLSSFLLGLAIGLLKLIF